MRRGRVLAAALAVVGVVGVAAAFAATVRVSWGYAIEVSGSAALNTGGSAMTNSVACASAGRCDAGGTYQDGSGHNQAFVVSEKNAEWGRAIEVPGTAALNTGGSAQVAAVSCATAGNCAAVGNYEDVAAHQQALVVNEANGIWGSAIEVPGTAALNTGGDARVSSVSCTGTGNCAAAGSYLDGSGFYQVFVVTETSGVWHTAIEVPGTAALNASGDARIYGNGVSCASAGNCEVGGSYRDGSGHHQAFVVSETSGVWHTAIEVPGTAVRNAGGDASVSSVSCATVGNCAAGGSYKDGAGRNQAFVVSETSGVWHTAIEVPGTATLNAGGIAKVSSVSCVTAGNCAAGGSYRDGSGHFQAFVASETSGVWHTAIEVPGTAVRNAGGNASVSSISCATAGNCAAGGYYRDGSGHYQVFVGGESNGVWGTARELPGTAALNLGDAILESVSCAKSGNCAVGGYYSEGGAVDQAFVTAP